MCRMLVDAMVWNYVGKAKAVCGFLASLPTKPATLTEVVDQLRPALGKWPELSAVMTAVEDCVVEAVELDQEEEELRISLLTKHPGLGVVDCGLLAVASRRQWMLLTCDQAVQKTSAKMDIRTADLSPLLDEAVDRGFLNVDDRAWVLAYAQGHSKHRDS